jgi:hypothetical protein
VVGKRKNKADVQSYVPVLGQYFDDALVAADYSFTAAGVNYPSFTVPTFKKYTTDAKTQKRTENIVPELPISLVDGNSSGVYLFINDPNQLRSLAMLWDDWIKTTGLQNFSVQLGTFGTEQGIKPLCSIAMTRHWAVIPPSMKIKLQDFVDERFKVRKRTFQTIYSGRSVLADTSQGTILAAPYEQVLQTWILPVNHVQVTTDVNNTQLQRWQAMMGEPYYVPVTTGETGLSLDTLHDNYASKMVKSKLAQGDDWTEFFKTMAQQGRGGILSALGGFFDETFGI